MVKGVTILRNEMGESWGEGEGGGQSQKIEIEAKAVCMVGEAGRINAGTMPL